MDLKQEFEQLMEEYKKIFLELYFQENENDLVDSYWIADEIGGVLCVQDDMFYSTDIIRYCVDNNVSWEDLDTWYQYCLRLGMIDPQIPVPNLKAWIGGCPRYQEDELKELERLADDVRKSQDKLYDAVTNIKNRS